MVNLESVQQSRHVRTQNGALQYQDVLLPFNCRPSTPPRCDVDWKAAHPPPALFLNRARCHPPPGSGLFFQLRQTESATRYASPVIEPLKRATAIILGRGNSTAHDRPSDGTTTAMAVCRAPAACSYPLRIGCKRHAGESGDSGARTKRIEMSPERGLREENRGDQCQRYPDQGDSGRTLQKDSSKI